MEGQTPVLKIVIEAVDKASEVFKKVNEEINHFYDKTKAMGVASSKSSKAITAYANNLKKFHQISKESGSQLAAMKSEFKNMTSSFRHEMAYLDEEVAKGAPIKTFVDKSKRQFRVWTADMKDEMDRMKNMPIQFKNKFIAPFQSAMGELNQFRGMQQVKDDLAKVNVTITQSGQFWDTLKDKEVSVDEVSARLNKRFPKFRMQMLSVMFAGFALQRAMSGLLRPAMQSAGVFQIIGTILQVVFLPIILLLLPYLIKVMNFFIKLPKPIKLVIGALVLIGMVLGTFLMIIGQVGLALGGLPEIFAVFESIIGFLAPIFTGIIEFLGGLASAIGAPIAAVVAVIVAFVVGFIQLFDEWKQTFIDIFKGAFDVIANVVKFFVSLFTLNFKGMKDSLNGIVEGILSIFKGFVKAILLIPLTIIEGFLKMIDWFLGIFGINSDLAGTFKQWIDALMKGIDDFFGWLGNIWKSSFDAIIGFMKWFGTTLYNVFKGPIDMIAGVVNWLIDIFRGAFDTITGIIDSIKNAIGGVVDTVGSFISNPLQSIGNLLGLAEGGIVTKPTLAMVGESGPEAVVPLDKLGNNKTVNFAPNINISATVSSDVDIYQLADTINKMLYEDLRRSLS